MGSLLTGDTIFFSEQARVAAGQLLRWKDDVGQDGYLLLKSAYVLTGTDSVSSGAAASPRHGQGEVPSVFLFLNLVGCLVSPRLRFCRTSCTSEQNGT